MFPSPRLTADDSSHQLLAAEFFVSRGYIFVSVDVRGTNRSQAPNDGPLVNPLFGPRITKDGVEVVDWAAHQLAGSNGVIGLYGCSQLGINQLFTAAAVGPHAPVKAVIPACASNSYNIYFSGGVPSATVPLFGQDLPLGGDKHRAENLAFGRQLVAEINASGHRARVVRHLAEEPQNRHRRHENAAAPLRAQQQPVGQRQQLPAGRQVHPVLPQRELRAHHQPARPDRRRPRGVRRPRPVQHQAEKNDCGGLLGLPQPCAYTAAQQASLAGGSYQIVRNSTGRSVVNLPPLPRGRLPAARSGVTPTSGFATEPLGW
nr:CocE/NonD family hydrolase [Frankia sp. R82]